MCSETDNSAKVYTVIDPNDPASALANKFSDGSELTQPVIAPAPDEYAGDDINVFDGRRFDIVDYMFLAGSAGLILSGVALDQLLVWLFS